MISKFITFIWLHWVLVVALGIFCLYCSMWNPVLWPGTEPRLPALGTWSLSHWTTREVPNLLRELKRGWSWRKPLSYLDSPVLGKGTRTFVKTLRQGYSWCVGGTKGRPRGRSKGRGKDHGSLIQQGLVGRCEDQCLISEKENQPGGWTEEWRDVTS